MLFLLEFINENFRHFPSTLCPELLVVILVSAKLLYTDTGSEHRVTNTTNEHHQWTSSQQFDTTNGQRLATSQHLDMLWCGNFVVELLWARPLVVSIGGVVQHVHSRCPCIGVWADVVRANLTGYGHVVACPLVVSVAGVRIVEFGPKSVIGVVWSAYPKLFISISSNWDPWFTYWLCALQNVNSVPKYTISSYCWRYTKLIFVLFIKQICYGHCILASKPRTPLIIIHSL